MRCVTLEEFLSPAISEDIEKLCLNIVNSVREASGYHTNISSMTLYFKMDENSRPWLLFCSRLKIRTTEDQESAKLKAFQKERDFSPIFKCFSYDKTNEQVTVDKCMIMSTPNEKIFKVNPMQTHCTICLSSHWT